MTRKYSLLALIALAMLAIPAGASAAGLSQSRTAGGELQIAYKADIGELNNIIDVRTVRSQGRNILRFRDRSEHVRALTLGRGCGRTTREAISRERVNTSVGQPTLVPQAERPVYAFCLLSGIPQGVPPRSARRQAVRSVWVRTGDQKDVVSLARLAANLAGVVELGADEDVFTAIDFEPSGHRGATSRAELTVCTGVFRRAAPGTNAREIPCDVPRDEILAPTALQSEVVTGGDGADVLSGTDRWRDGIQGGGGDDLLRLGGGDDIGIGGPGNDTINGGTGNDQLDIDFLGQLVEPLVADEQMTAGTDTLNGDAGDEDTVGHRFATRPVNASPTTLRTAQGVGPGQTSDTVTGAEVFYLGKGDDSFSGNLGTVPITVHGMEGSDSINVSGNPDRTIRDTVYCGNISTGFPSNSDQVRIDAPRAPRPGEHLLVNPTEWLRDSTHDCERVVLSDGTDENEPLGLPSGLGD